MELIRHNNIKTMRRKSHKLWSKDTKLKDKTKGSTKNGEKKNLMSPHLYIYLLSGSYDLELSSFQRIIIMK
jgi:hypothetical protein